jgi:type II secretory pathway pseudopilin PulG
MKKYSGFTLLEILLYVVIGGITLSIAVFSFAQINRLYTSFRVNNELNQNGNSIIEKIQNIVNQANTIVSPQLGNESSEILILTSSDVDTTITKDDNDLTVSYSNNDPSFNLNSSGILVNNLSFEQINTQNNDNTTNISQVIKLTFTLRYDRPAFSSFEYEAEKSFEATLELSNKTTSFEPILNTYPTGANGVAYSLRKLAGLNTSANVLSSASNGPAIRVRRDSGLDQSEMDIGFNSKGDLDTVALQNFVGYQNFFTYSEDITSPAGGWDLANITTISNITDAGLYGERFNGYYNDNPAFFNSAVRHGDTNTTSQINNFTSNADFYSWQWVGYFLPPTTGTYTFFTASDDASHLWLGDNAISGYTVSNTLVNNGGLHGVQERSGSINLTAGQYYPIRIMFGENSGGDIMTVAFSGPGITKTTNGAGYYFGGRYFWDKFVTDSNYTAPDGTDTPKKINLITGNNQRFILKNTNVLSDSNYTDSYYVKANNGYNFVQITPSTGFPIGAYQNYNLSNGTLAGSFGIIPGQANIQPVGNDGWYRISLSATANASGSGRMVLAIVNSSNSARLEGVNVSNPTDSIFVWGAMRHLSNSLTSPPKPYQKTFANANTGDGYITTWYDQSGNNNNAIQTNTSAQPKIVDGVTGIVSQNNKPSIRFDGSNDQLINNSFNNASNSTVFFIASRPANNQSFMARLTNYATLGATDLFNPYYLNKSSTSATAGSDTKNSLNLYTAIRTSAINSALNIGAGSVGNFLNGHISELIIYNGNKLGNKLDIENNLRDYYGTP